MLFLKARPTCPAVAARRSGRAPLQCRAAGTPPAMRTFEAPAASPQTPASAPASASTTASPSSAAAPARDPATTSPYRVSLWNALKFNGPAPEKINGRLAMLAMPLLARGEMETGRAALDQALHPSWGVLAFMVLVVWGSLIPIQKGAIDEPLWVFTPAAERWNGRLAMLGVAGLLALEYYTGGVPFF